MAGGRRVLVTAAFALALVVPLLADADALRPTLLTKRAAYQMRVACGKTPGRYLTPVSKGRNLPIPGVHCWQQAPLEGVGGGATLVLGCGDKRAAFHTVAKCTKDKPNDVAKLTVTVQKKLHCRIVAKCALRRAAK